MRNGPDYIQLYPTLRCNMSCAFCFNRSMPFIPDMSLDELRSILKTLSALMIRTLDIMGGEPTLHPHLAGLVREAVRRGLHVNISSNGTRPEVLEELLLMGSAVTVGLSVNDRSALERLTGFIQKNRPIVKSVFCKAMDEELIRDILLLGPEKYYLIYRDVLDKRDLESSWSFHQYLSAVERQNFYHRIGQVFCSGFIPDSGNYPDLALVRCPAGTTKLGIMPNGDVYPCNLFFGNKGFLLGNALTDPFDHIWNRRTLDFFRDYARNQCSKASCELHARCHGGCPAHSFAHTGKLSATDPRCVAG